MGHLPWIWSSWSCRCRIPAAQPRPRDRRRKTRRLRCWRDPSTASSAQSPRDEIEGNIDDDARTTREEPRQTRSNTSRRNKRIRIPTDRLRVHVPRVRNWNEMELQNLYKISAITNAQQQHNSRKFPSWFLKISSLSPDQWPGIYRFWSLKLMAKGN